MAQCALSPQEFVQNAFNPCIAVLSSTKAEAMCRKNNLSFVEMVQPFCKLNTEAHLRDPMNQTYVVRHLRISLSDMNYEPPKPLVARKMLYEVIASTIPNMGDRSRTSTINTNGYSIQINNSTPWFEAYRGCFLTVAPATDHEFISHFLACIFVVASSDSEPLQEFAKLAQQQQNHQQQNASKATKWFFPVSLRYYVLLHDVTECEQMKTETLFKNLQATYGAINCYLLQINSRHSAPNTINMEESQANLPDPWSQFLSQKPVTEFLEADFSSQSANKTSVLETSVQQENDYLNFKENSSVFPVGVVDHPLMPDRETEAYSDFPMELNIQNGDSFCMGTSHSDMNSSDFGLDHASNGRLSASPHTFDSSEQALQPCQAIQHGMHLTLGDVEQLRLFVQEFCLKALLPYIEKQMNILHEAVTNRKGLHRSFFNATKKWFGGNKPAPAAGNVASSFIVYSPEAIELQVRRLGDLAFMFQNYDLAYHAYHNLKRDFNSDQAWMHFAGALEMAALAVFMQGTNSQRQLPLHYFDNAISTYLNTCKSLHFATRATLLSTECLKHYERYLDAASYFIRLTSEESDLRSALLLEQAAHCFANLKNPYVRKYAFYMILAGHRFNKAGQKRHSLRSYKQALQVYEGQQWLFAEDHINLTAGRLNFSLNNLEEAMRCFHRLLYDGSLQCETQQSYYLREYLAISSYLWGANGRENGHLPELPLPVVDSQNCKVRLGDMNDCQVNSVLPSAEPSDEPCDVQDSESIWYGLEEKAIVEAIGSVPVSHKPLLCCCSAATNNSLHPVAVVDEPITVELNVRNPLRVPLCLANVRLLWAFKPLDATDDAEWITSAHFPKCDQIQVNLVVVPRQTGKLHIQGIAYSLMTQQSQLSLTTPDDDPSLSSAFAVTGMQPLKVIGPRMNSTKEERCGEVYREDKRLEPVVVPSMPRLMVRQHNIPASLLCGEVTPIAFEFYNHGQVGLRRLLLATSHPHLLAFGIPSTKPPSRNTKVYESLPANPSASVNCKGVFKIPFPENCDILEPGKHFWVPAWIRGPDVTGTQSLNLLFYYENLDGQNSSMHKLPHRVFRSKITLHTTSALTASAVAISGSKPIGKNLYQNLTVAMEISNSYLPVDGSNIQLLLSQISCVSHCWKMELNSKRTSEEILIGTKEALHFCFRAVEQNRKGVEKDTGQLHFSNITFARSEINSGSTPCFDFLQSTAVLTGSEEIVDKDRNVIHKDKDSSVLNKTPQELLLNSRVKFSIVIFWEARCGNGDVRCGQHHLLLKDEDVFVSTRPEAKVLEDKPPVRFTSNADHASKYSKYLQIGDVLLSSEKLLKYFMFANSDVQHDFAVTRMCTIPVFLVLSNCVEAEVIAVVDTGKLAPGSLPMVTASPVPCLEASRFVWVGLTRVTLTLQPQETRVVQLRACFFSSGTYSLSGVAVTARLESGDGQQEAPQTGVGQIVIVGKQCADT